MTTVFIRMLKFVVVVYTDTACHVLTSECVMFKKKDAVIVFILSIEIYVKYVKRYAKLILLTYILITTAHYGK